MSIWKWLGVVGAAGGEVQIRQALGDRDVVGGELGGALEVRDGVEGAR